MVVKIFKFFLVSVFISLPVKAQGITARASADSADYDVGDFINYTIEVEYSKGIEIFSPAIKDSLKNVELLFDSAPVSTDQDGIRKTVFKYVISKYDSGDVVIPPVPVLYRTENDTTIQYAFTNEVNFTVHTLGINPEDDIKDVKDPIKIPIPWWEIVLYIMGVLLLALIIYFIYQRYKKKKSLIPAEKKELKLPPHVIALSSLEALDKEQLWQNGKIKEYHSIITEIIRKYFEDRFDFPALELTTSESIELLRKNYEAEKIVELTQEFLSNADLVKFAKYIPMNDVNIEMMKQAFLIVESTIPHHKPEEVQEAENVR